MTEPIITGVHWLPVSSVLKNEAAQFTPWLASNLDLLGDALGLQDLALVGTEHDVMDKRLDILAECVGIEGATIPVVIENQYGKTDHSHLGQLITYLSQQGRGYAVWVTEHVHDAHLSAVNFLNRATGADDVGFFLVRARFTHGLAGTHQVHFEVVARPNEFEKPSKRTSTGDKTSPRYQYALALQQLLDLPLRAAGWASTGVHIKGFIWVRWPSKLWVTSVSHHSASVRPHEQSCQVSVRINRAGDRAANEHVVGLIRQAYEAEIAKLIDAEDELLWDAGTTGAPAASFAIRHPEGGYADGDPRATAEWAERILTGLLNAVTNHPVQMDLPPLL
jgi:hypothetical protein